MNKLIPEATTARKTRLAPSTEAESRAIAEDAREKEWRAPSFVRSLFEGALRLDLIHPFPEIDPVEIERAQPFLQALERFLRTQVDSDRIDREAAIPPEVIQGLRELGALGIKIPQEYGGLGFSQTNYAHAITLVASHDGSLAELLPAAQSIGVPMPLMLFGTPEQKQKYLPRLAKGAISAFALTELNAGSDPAAMRTTAELAPDGTYYTLNGEKLWISNGTIADLMVVMARTGAKYTAFIVEMHWPGIEVGERLKFMGLRGMENGCIRFTNVKVPIANVLWGEGKGLKLALITLNTGRLTLPAGCVGAAKRCLAIARRWAAERVQWGKPIGKHDAIAQLLGRMAADIFAMESVSDLACGMADQGGVDIRLEAAVAKLWNSETGWRIVDDTVQIKGGRGYETADSLRSRGERPDPVERILRDFRINRIFEGTSEIMRLFIAREAVDTHLKLAGDLIDPKTSTTRKLQALFKSILFYGQWYPKLWLGGLTGSRYREFGPLATHLRFVHRNSRRLARTLFHCMLRYGGGLEKRQVLLGRLVNIGAELLAIASACARAQAMAGKNPASRGPTELADLFSRQARRRIKSLFSAVWRNDDDAIYALAQQVIGHQHTWLERGIISGGTE